MVARSHGLWKQVVMGSAVVLGGTLVSRCFTFLYSAILIRELSVPDYAVFSLLMSILSWALVLSHFDLYVPVSKFVSENMTVGRSLESWDYYCSALVLSFFLSLAGVVVALGFSLQVSANRLLSLVFFLSILPMSLVTINDGLIKGYQKFSLSALVDIAGGMSRFLLIAGFVLLNGCLALNNVLPLMFVASLVPMITSYILVSRLVSPGTLKRSMDRKRWGQLLRYSKWVCMTDLTNTGSVLALNLMLSFYSYEDLARFAVMMLLYSILQLSYGAITTVIIPKVASASASGLVIKSLGKKELFYLFCATLALSAALYFFPYQEQILRLILGKSQYVDSIRLAAIFLLALPFRIVTMTNKGILQGLGYPEDAAKISLAALFLLTIVMVPLYTLLQLKGIILALLMAYSFEYLLYGRATRVRLERLFPRAIE